MSELRGSATITSSSEFSTPTYADDNVVDGNNSTEWATSGESSTSWIQFDWGSPVSICEIRLLTRASDGNWGNPRFTFSDSAYSDGSVCIQSNQDVTYVLSHPKTTTSLRISIATQTKPAQSANNGFREIYISDAYTVAPSTDLTKPDHLAVSSQYDANTYSKWNTINGVASVDWASNDTGAAAWIQFEWLSAVYIESIQLRDRIDGSVQWGIPRFTFDDASFEDGVGPPNNSGLTTYTLATPKTSTTLKIGIASGGANNTRGLDTIIITGNITPPAPPAVGRSFGVIIL